MQSRDTAPRGLEMVVELIRRVEAVNIFVDITERAYCGTVSRVHSTPTITIAGSKSTVHSIQKDYARIRTSHQPQTRPSNPPTPSHTI